MRLLTGQLRPSRGTVTRTGTVGWSPQHTAALAGFTVAEQVRYASWLVGLSRKDAVTQARRAIERTRLDELADRPRSDCGGTSESATDAALTGDGEFSANIVRDACAFIGVALLLLTVVGAVAFHRWARAARVSDR